MPFSQLVYESTRWWPKIYSFPLTYIWQGGAKEKDRIEQAVRTTLLNHPVFQMQVNWRGQQYAAPLKDILHGPYHDIEISTEDDDAIIRMTISRILGDAKSGEILIEDVQRVLDGIPLERDDYWEYLEYVEQQKQSEHYGISRDWLMSEYADESVPVHPTIDRCLWTLFPPKPGLYKVDYTDLHNAINRLSETEFLSMDGFFSLCAILAIAEYCGTEAAALTWAYEGRERPEEQRIFGSLHRDIPFQITNLQFPISNLQSNLIRQARNQIRSGIAHSDYPYTLTAPYNKRWNYAVNVLRVPELEYEQKYAYALLDMEIHEADKNFALWFRYSATHYKKSSIRRFAALVRKYAEWLLEE